MVEHCSCPGYITAHSEKSSVRDRTPMSVESNAGEGSLASRFVVIEPCSNIGDVDALLAVVELSSHASKIEASPRPWTTTRWTDGHLGTWNRTIGPFRARSPVRRISASSITMRFPELRNR